jgi:hypothetical protein
MGMVKFLRRRAVGIGTIDQNGLLAARAADGVEVLISWLISKMRMPTYTLGFINPRQLQRHFVKHGVEFGAATAADYEALADQFLGAPKAISVRECIRKSGDTCRFCTVTDAYAVLDRGRMIRTFYKPVPCISLPAPQRPAMKLAGRCHPHSSNLLYFQSRC